MLLRTALRSLALCVFAFALSIPLFAQQPQDDTAPSVAEAARRARQQKQDAAKPAHVIDNDSIPSAPASSADSPAPAAPASDSNSPKPPEGSSASSEAAKSDGDKAEDEKKRAEIDALKQEIADKLERVNLQQREIALAQDTFNSNPDREHDNAGKEKLDSMQSDLAQLQAQLTELQAKLAGLNPPSEEKAPETPKP
jgi:hypothetical protein